MTKVRIWRDETKAVGWADDSRIAHLSEDKETKQDNVVEVEHFLLEPVNSVLSDNIKFMFSKIRARERCF